MDMIAASLRAHGQYKPVLVNRGTHTGRALEVLAGNHTVKAFRQLAEEYPDEDRWQTVNCWIVDVDDDRAARIVAVDNRTSELGSFDDGVLLELLESAPTLEGTGYDDSYIGMLRDLLDGPPPADENDDPQPEPDDDDDPRVIIRLSLEPPVALQWADHRRGFDTDDEAMAEAINRAQ